MSAVVTELRSGDAEAVARRSPSYRPPHSSPPRGALVAGTASVTPVNNVDARLGAASPGHPAGPKAGREFKTLSAQQVVDIHFALVENFARTPDPIDPPGVKNADLLESAVARQFTSLGGELKYKTLAHMAASLFYGLALNHPFHNGNKRTALVALICLADANDLNVTADQDALYDFVLRVVRHGFRPTAQMPANAAMDLEIEAVGSWIRPHLRRQAHFQRMVHWRELRAALRQLGVRDLVTSNTQIELIRNGLRSVVDFDGDTREVHPGVVRKIRKDLALTTRDGCDDDIFYGDALPLDHFIAKYRGLLRELASV